MVILIVDEKRQLKNFSNKIQQFVRLCNMVRVIGWGMGLLSSDTLIRYELVGMMLVTWTLCYWYKLQRWSCYSVSPRSPTHRCLVMNELFSTYNGWVSSCFRHTCICKHIHRHWGCIIFIIYTWYTFQFSAKSAANCLGDLWTHSAAFVLTFSAKLLTVWFTEASLKN